MMQLEFDWPADGGYPGSPAHGPTGFRVPARRADVVAELTASDIYAVQAPADHSGPLTLAMLGGVNYYGARNSMGELI
jgi:hypothetical protein